MGYSKREYYNSGLDANTGVLSPLAPKMLDNSNNPIYTAPPSIYLLFGN